MKRLLLLLAIHLAGAGLCGCGGQAIAPDRLATIPTFSVDKEVPLPAAPGYYGKAQMWGSAIGGAVGGAVMEGGNNDVPGRIKSYLEQEHVDVQQIVRSEFQQRLSTDPRFVNRVVDNGAAHFKLNVFVYGLFEAGIFHSGYKIWLGIQATLVDSSGNTLWQDKNWVGLDSDIPAHAFDDYFSDPSVFAGTLKTGADEITERLLNSLGH